MTPRTKSPCEVHVTILVVLSIHVPAVVAGADPPLRLLTLGEPAAELTVTAAVQEHTVDVDLATLRTLPAVVDIELPGRVLHSVHRTALYRHDRGFTWIGRLGGAEPADAARADVTLAVHGEALSGVLSTADGLYHIVPLADAGHRLALIDTNLYPPCAESIPVPAVRTATPTPPRPPEPPGRIDVLVVYSPAARAAAGGVDQVKATVQAAVDLANTAFANSEVHTTFFLAHSQEVAYSESGNLFQDLNWVSSDAAVAALRDFHHADLVGLVISAGDGCGLSFVQNEPDPSFEAFAFQVTVLSCAVGNMTLAHEMAHLQGCEHNPEDTVRGPGEASFPWAFGHHHSGSYRTVMSSDAPCFASPCPRKPYFSNADVLFDDLPTGVLDERENYRVLDATAPIVANFRQRPAFVFADGYESGDFSRWSCAGACGE